MSAANIIRHFETQTKLHVKIKDVLSQIRAAAPPQRIEFYEEKHQEADVLRGFLIQDWLRLGWADEDDLVSYIVYNGNMEKDWCRLVACKELVHILDPQYAITNTREDLRSLIERMSVPLDLQGRNNQEIGDRIGEYQALAILFPRAAREILMPKYAKDKTLSAKEIAILAGIPERYIAYLMSDDWVEMYDLLVKPSEDDSP